MFYPVLSLNLLTVFLSYISVYIATTSTPVEHVATRELYCDSTLLVPGYFFYPLD
jgi:hypothetical protein